MHKAYIHIEAGVAGPGAPAHTTIVRGGGQVGAALTSFCASFEARYGLTLDAAGLTAQIGWPDGQEIPMDASLRDVSPTGGDVWTVMKTRAPAPQPGDPGNAAVILARAEAAASAGRLASASSLYDALVMAAPTHLGALLGRARLWGRAGAWAQALPAAKAAAAAHPADPPARTFLGDCLYETGDLEGALFAYDAALNGAGGDTAVHAAAWAGVADTLVAQRARVAARLDPATPSTTAALLAAHDTAKGGVEAALTADGTSARALVAYARLARSVPGDLAVPGVGGPTAAARALLRALASHPRNDAAQRALADLVTQDPGGEAALWAELGALGVRSAGTPTTTTTAPAGEADAAALAFLASCLKAHGAAAVSQRFSIAAAAAAPLSALYALASSQTAELWGDPAAPAAGVAAWCGRWTADPAAAAAAPPVLVTAMAGIGDACRGLPPRPVQRGDKASALGWLASDTWTGGEGGGRQRPLPPSPPPAQAAVAFTDAHLDAIALACTALRVLYCGGALARAAAASAALAAVRECAAPPLHAGRARNEDAFAACVAALLTEGASPERPVLLESEGVPAVSPVFLLGDSHTLPLAWRKVGPPASPRLTIPLLVTGLKVWDLRPGGVFFPRAGWDAAVAGLPDGATIITLVGEIDAREGLLLAIEKLKYPTLDAATAAAAAAYGCALQALVDDARAFRVAVHPVPPVLDETRHVVRALNAAMKAEVGRLARGAACAPGRLAWLDLEACLLTEDGSALRPELALDGTHLAPAYVKYVEAALAELGW
jgi:tetratricopeptide (TPR) repeat protein